MSPLLLVVVVALLLAPAAAGLFLYAVGRNIDGCRVVERSTLMKLLGLEGLALFPTVLVAGAALTARGDCAAVLRHERIHIAQQAELLVVPFYVLYVLEGAARAATGGLGAYHDIAFEREAYANERKGAYLWTRRPFAWRRYFWVDEPRRS